MILYKQEVEGSPAFLVLYLRRYADDHYDGGASRLHSSRR